MQMSTAADWALETTFPNPFGAFISLFSALTEFSLQHLIPLDCVRLYNHHDHVVLVTIGPLALMGVFAASGVVLSRLGRTGWSQKSYSAVLLISFLTLPTTSTTLFRTFHCEEFDNGERWLRAVSRDMFSLCVAI